MYLNSPPQGRSGHRVNAELVSKEKEKIFAQWFGKDICSLLQRGNMRGFKETLIYFFTNKMEDKARYSASAVEHATVLCFLLHHEIKFAPR